MPEPLQIEKVMLIFPPLRMSTVGDKIVCPPMGLAYLASMIRDRYEVKILDATALGREQERSVSWNFFEYGLSVDQIVAEVEKFAPQVVGISCLFSFHFLVIKELCERIKNISSRIVTVTGGTHPSFLPEASLRSAPGLDFIVLGEGEESFPELLKALEKGSGFEQIDGLAWRENSSVRINPKTRFIEDLDRIPFPSRDLLPMEKYFEINVPFMFYSRSPRNTSFLTSRGCPFQCAFCSSCHFWGNRVRYRSIENVMQELRELKRRYRVEEIKFEEDNLLLNRERAKKLFRAMIEEKLNLYWNMPNGAYIMSLLDEELVSLMKQSGCFEVTMAFESGDQQVLDNIIKKPLDLTKAERAVKILRDHDIEINSFFIVGLPGETREQIKNTLRLQRRLKLDHAFTFVFNPLPGSALYSECVDKKYIDPEKCLNINYADGMITNDQFNPAWLRGQIYIAFILQNLSLFLRNPRKFFGKNLKRVFRKQSFSNVPRFFRTLVMTFYKR